MSTSVTQNLRRWKEPESRAQLRSGLPMVLQGRSRQQRWVYAIVVIAVAALLPEYAGISELTRVQQILLYVMVGFGLNIGLGYAGEFAVAQPVILGVSAYTAGILSAHYNISSWVTLPCAIVSGCVVGFALSAPGFRLRGWYLAVTTFFAAVIFPDVVDLFTSVTGGTNGLAGIKPLPGVGLVLGSSPTQYRIVLGITLVLMLGMYNLSRSTWGVILRGLRDAPRATEACGINVKLVKGYVSIVSAIPVAVAGWAWAHIAGVISTDTFSLNLSIIIIAGVVIGGMGTVWGPVIGTVVVEIVSLWIGPFSDYNNLLVGAAIVFFAILMPHGIVHAWTAFTGWLAKQAGPPTRPAAETTDADVAAAPASVRADGGPAGPTPPQAPISVPSEPALPAAGQPAPVGAETALQPGEMALQPGDTIADGSMGVAGEPILELSGVRKHFGGVVVLEGVEMVVRRGEVVGLIGPNGSGKTTLLNIMTGHIRADEGQALLFGRSVLGKSPHRIAAAGVRRTFQVPRLIGEMSVFDNVRLGLLGARSQEVLGSIFLLPGYRNRARRHVERIETVCDLVGLTPDIQHRRVDGLPLGLRRVVEVARAVVSGPAIVCLDEPGAGLGGEELVRLRDVMRRVADAGSGVLLVEHNLDFVRNVSDRVLEMRDGQAVSLPVPAQQDREAMIR
jgi:branched-chain amino acid transport system permease protein